MDAVDCSVVGCAHGRGGCCEGGCLWWGVLCGGVVVVVGRLAWFNVEGCESERCLVIVGGVVVGGGGEFESAGGVECG